MAHGLSRRLLDSHIHLWDLEATPQDWIDPVAMAAIDQNFTATDLAAQLTDVGVTRAIAVQADHSLDETRMLLDATTEASQLAGVVGWVDAAADVGAQLDSLGEHPAASHLVGIRHLSHLPGDEDWLRRDDVARGIQALGGRGLSIDLIVRDWQLRDAAALVAKAPETTFVLDHLANPAVTSGDLAQWRIDLAFLAQHPNVVAKVSGLTGAAGFTDWSVATLSPAFEHALEVFAPDRLMFGSDWPLIRLSTGAYRGWLQAYLELTAPLSADEQTAIDSGTAERTYRL